MWFRHFYRLPPNDRRFLALTPEEVEAEFWRHHFATKGPDEEFEDETFDDTADAALAKLDASGGDWEAVISDLTGDGSVGTPP